jgi:hypothetical protein
MGALDAPKAADVSTLTDFLRYVATFHGTPTNKGAHIAFWKGFAKFLDNNEHWQGRGITFNHLARTCEWAVAQRKKRLTGASAVLYFLDEAVKCGVVPELEQKSEEELSDDQFYEVLAIETDPEWRRYLISTQGSARRQAMKEWKQARG